MDYKFLVKLKPDLIFTVHGITSPEVATRIQELGISVYFQNMEKVDDVFDRLQDIGRLVHRDAYALFYSDSLRQQLKTITNQKARQAPKPSVLAITWNDPIYVYGHNTIFTDKMQLIGAVNAVPEVMAQPYPALTREYILKINPDVIIKSILFWSMGDFGRANWDFLPYPAVALLLGLLLFRFQVKELNALLLGEERAQTLGMHIVRARWLILITVAVLCGFSVALAGSVGFVGIIIPHVTRALLGITYKNNLLICAWLGGIFMVGCDILSKFIYPPAGLPIGIITSFFGVPFFVYLLLKKQYYFS